MIGYVTRGYATLGSVKISISPGQESVSTPGPEVIPETDSGRALQGGTEGRGGRSADRGIDRAPRRERARQEEMAIKEREKGGGGWQRGGEARGHYPPGGGGGDWALTGGEGEHTHCERGEGRG